MGTELMTPAAVAEALGVSASRVRQMANEGVLLPVAQGDRMRLYSREQVESVARARTAAEKVRVAGTKVGAHPGVAGHLGDLEEKKELRRIARANLSKARQRARRRLDGLRARLAKLDEQRVPVAAELAAIDAEREALLDVIERLGAELAVYAPAPARPVEMEVTEDDLGGSLDG